MKLTWKWTLWASAAAAIVFFAPIIFTVLTARGARGYFDTGKSIAGQGPIFVYIGRDQGFGYYSYCPGSGRRERLYQLRTRQPGSAGQVPAPPTGHAELEAIRDDGTVAFRLRTRDGQLWSTSPYALPQERWLIFTNYFRMGRVYNIWRVWIPSLSAN
jgi:hypothetical protein